MASNNRCYTFAKKKKSSRRLLELTKTKLHIAHLGMQALRELQLFLSFVQRACKRGGLQLQLAAALVQL
jgi:hypothetical protein